MRNIKPIQTKYKGILFRSKLEARWAIYLDLLGLSWEYEYEGFSDGNINYLPDFIVENKFFLEVKPQRGISKKEEDKIKMCSMIKPIFVTCGYPSVNPCICFMDGERRCGGVILAPSMREKYGHIYYTENFDTYYFDQENELSIQAMDYDLIYQKQRLFQ